MTGREVYKWSVAERIGECGIAFVGNIILARLLTPADFGLLAMIAIFSAVVVNLSNCGISDGIIHKLKPEAIDYSTAFVYNTTIGFVAAVLAFAFAPAIAAFFHHEELLWIMRIYGVCFFFQTMCFVQETRMRKLLQYKRLCVSRLGASLAAYILGIGLALAGAGYWALVSTHILISFFIFVSITAASRWWPGVKFSTSTCRNLLSFGFPLMLAYLANMVSNNISTFVLGKHYPTPTASGLYSQASKLGTVPFLITERSLNDSFFVLASNEEDAAKRRRMVRRMALVIFAVNSAIAAGLIVFARPAIELLYGERWLAAAPVLRVIAVTQFMMGVKYFCQTLFKLRGRTPHIRNVNFVELGIQVALLLIFYRQGLVAVALTQTAAVACSLAIYAFMLRRKRQE